ncbi:MAG: peptidylprolyl isomerase [Candidatus Cloacimonadales bacterium]
MKKWMGLILLFLLILGCEKEPDLQIVAQVNDEVLSMEQLKSAFSDEQWQLKSKAEKKELVQNWIDLTAMAQVADQLEISETLPVLFRLENAAKTIKSNALLAQEIAEIEVTENDLFDYYKLHQSRYKSSYLEYNIQRIFSKDLETTEQALAAMRNGMNFDETAKKYSQESAGANGGYIGFKRQEELEAAAWQRLTELRQWRYDRINTENGYYIVRYIDSRNVEIDKNFKEVKNEIRKLVLAEKQRNLYKNFVEKVRQQTETIKISI